LNVEDDNSFESIAVVIFHDEYCPLIERFSRTIFLFERLNNEEISEDDESLTLHFQMIATHPVWIFIEDDML